MKEKKKDHRGEETVGRWRRRGATEVARERERREIQKEEEKKRKKKKRKKKKKKKKKKKNLPLPLPSLSLSHPRSGTCPEAETAYVRSLSPLQFFFQARESSDNENLYATDGYHWLWSHCGSDRGRSSHSRPKGRGVPFALRR